MLQFQPYDHRTRGEGRYNIIVEKKGKRERERERERENKSMRA